MTVELGYPGVYIVEVPSGVHTITGVSTSIAAFIGYTAQGPVNTPIQIFNFGDFERAFGGLNAQSQVSYAVQQFFINGGTTAWVVRVANGAAPASFTLNNIAGTEVLTAKARTPGDWGNYLRLDVDYATTNPDDTFNLFITQFVLNGVNQVVNAAEQFKNLSMNPQSPYSAVSVVNASSKLVSLESTSATATSGTSASGNLSTFPPAGFTSDTNMITVSVDGQPPQTLPLFTGNAPTTLANLITAIRGMSYYASCGFTASQVSIGNIQSLVLTSTNPGDNSSVIVTSAPNNNAAKLLKLGLRNGGREASGSASLRPKQTGTISGDLSTYAPITTANPKISMTVTVTNGASTLGTATIDSSEFVGKSSLSDLQQTLLAQLQQVSPSNKVFNKAQVKVVGKTLQVIPGITDIYNSNAQIQFADAGTPPGLASKLLLITPVQPPSATYATSVNVRSYTPSGGLDGNPPSAVDLTGSISNKTGLYSLENIDLFNILCIPDTTTLSESAAQSVIASAMEYCEARRAFYIVDAPPDKGSQFSGIQTWVADNLTPSKNAAVYFPYVVLADPLDGYRLKSFPPSGTVAGVYARTDGSRGVWKAPAGTEASLKNVQALSYFLSDGENGVLNQLGINCLRQLNAYGRVVWGARTTEGNDIIGSEWKYVPVRRLALYIEESLYRGTQWAVFEPNDSPLWSQIRLNVGSFMQTLFVQGAFQGTTPGQAYFVRCDETTTTQNDIDRGIVNIWVGFAPVKPAEFVVINIQQIAGQTAA